MNQTHLKYHSQIPRKCIYYNSVKLLLALSIRYVQQTISKNVDKMVAAYQFALVDTLPYSFISIYPFGSIFHIFYQTLTQVGIWPLADNQNGR